MFISREQYEGQNNNIKTANTDFKNVTKFKYFLKKIKLYVLRIQGEDSIQEIPAPIPSRTVCFPI